MPSWVHGPGVVELPDGRTVRARGLRHPMPDGVEPELGVYLLGKRPDLMPWQSMWIRWRDFGTPGDTPLAVATLTEVYQRAVDERVEVACGGGVGRTGTALAFMAMLAGLAPDDAIGWVRQVHHPRAVETPWQRRWLRRLG